jgi:hypothetical protein
MGERLDHRAELPGHREQLGEDHVRLGEVAAPLLHLRQAQPGHVLLRAVAGDVGAIDRPACLVERVIELAEPAQEVDQLTTGAQFVDRVECVTRPRTASGSAYTSRSVSGSKAYSKFTASSSQPPQ